MKVFAIVILLLTIPATIEGLGATLIGNSTERIVGPPLLVTGIVGMLLCCVVMVLADIRTELRAGIRTKQP